MSSEKEKIIKYLMFLFDAQNIKLCQIIKYLMFSAVFIFMQYIEGKCCFLQKYQIASNVFTVIFFLIFENRIKTANIKYLMF